MTEHPKDCWCNASAEVKAAAEDIASQPDQAETYARACARLMEAEKRGMDSMRNVRGKERLRRPRIVPPAPGNRKLPKITIKRTGGYDPDAEKGRCGRKVKR